MPFPETFTTARLTAERLRAQHFAAIRAMESDPAYMALLGGPRRALRHPAPRRRRHRRGRAGIRLPHEVLGAGARDRNRHRAAAPRPPRAWPADAGRDYDRGEPRVAARAHQDRPRL